MAVVEETSVADRTFELPLVQLHLPEDNVRSKLGDVAELAQSIKTMGVLEPIVVMPRSGDLAAPDGYLVVCGSRRVAAAAAAELTHVPAIVRVFSEQERLEVMIAENLQRADLTPLEEAAAFQRLADIPLSQRMIAQRLGVSQGHVSKRLSLLALPKKARDLIDAGGINLEAAQELAKIADSPAAVTRALAEISHYGGGAVPSYIIERHVRAAQQEREQTAAIEKLKVRGERAVVRCGEWNAPKGYARVDPHAYGAVHMPVAKHRKEPCHATGVVPGGKEVELCSDPSRHPDEAAASTQTAMPGESKEQKRYREQREALQEAQMRRHEFLKGLCAKRLPKDDLLQLATIALVDGDLYGGDEELAYELLGLVDEDDAAATVDGITLPEFAARGDAERARVAAAVAFGIIDGHLGYYGRSLGSFKAYFEFLERKGYEISPAERAELDEAPR